MTNRAFTQTAEQIQEEQRLVVAAQQDPRHFGPLYSKYYRQMFLFVFKRVAEEDTAADIVAQVFLKAMQNLAGYTFRGLPFSSWLYRIALNEVNQYFRKQAGNRCVSIDTSQLGEFFEEMQDSPAADQVGRLVSALNQLKPDELELIELRFFEKVPFREVADIYGITENNAKVKMYRLLGKLRKWMERDAQASPAS